MIEITTREGKIIDMDNTLTISDKAQQTMEVGSNDQAFSTSPPSILKKRSTTVMLKDSEQTIQNNLSDLNIGSSTPRPKKIQKLSIEGTKRHEIGGKGHFLYTIQSLGLSVPDFFCLTLENTTDLFHIKIPNSLQDIFLKQESSYFLALITTEAEITLMQCVNHIKSLSNQDQSAACIVLQNMMKDVSWSKYVQTQPQGQSIVKHYQQQSATLLIQDPVIVRSSGIDEDNYGQAQAGKYDSIVVPLPTHEHILSTIFQVLASGIQKDTVTLPDFKPMAVIIQQHIQMKSGGVGFSCASLKNFSHNIRIGSESLSNTVSGIGAQDQSTQSCVISRDNNSVEIPYLTANNATQLTQTLVTLESQLSCPVDVEFVEDQQEKLWILQVRPITQLPGASVYQVSQDLQTRACGKGSVCSDGLKSGSFYIMNASTDLNSIPEQAIVFSEQGYPSMLNSEFMERIGGLIIPDAHPATHLAIQCHSYKVPFMSGCITKPNIGERVTLLCGTIQNQDQGQALCWRQNQTHLIPRVEKDIPLDLKQYQSLKHQHIPYLDVDLKIHNDVFDLLAWLGHQNTHLLDYLRPNNIFDNLLNSLQSIQWLMHKARLEFMEMLEKEVDNFISDCISLASHAFILGQHINSLLPPTDECSLETTYQVLELFKSHLTSDLNSYVHQLKQVLRGKEGLSIPDWQKTCKQMHTLLVKDDTAKDITSFHKGIRKIHQEFIKYQSKMNKAGIINNGSEEFLSPACKEIIKDGVFGTYQDQCRITLSLGVHKCTIIMKKEAEKNTSFQLECDYSELVYACPNGSQYRIWFIFKLINIYFNKNVEFNSIEIDQSIFLKFTETHIENIDTLQQHFIILCQILQGLLDFDIFWDKLPFNQELFGLKKALSFDPKTEPDEIKDKFQLFLFYYFLTNNIGPDTSMAVVQKLPEEYQAYLDCADTIQLIKKEPIGQLPPDLYAQLQDTYFTFKQTNGSIDSTLIEFMTKNGSEVPLEFITTCTVIKIIEKLKHLSVQKNISPQHIAQVTKYMVLINLPFMTKIMLKEHYKPLTYYDFLVQFLTILSNKSFDTKRILQLDFNFIANAVASQPLSEEQKDLLLNLWDEVWPTPQGSIQ